MFKRGRIYYDYVDGKKVSSKLTNKAKAADFFRKEKNKIEEEGSRLKGYSMTLAELFAKFLESKRGQIKEVTHDSSRSILRQFLRIFCGEDITFVVSQDGVSYKGNAKTKVIQLTPLDVSEGITKMRTGKALKANRGRKCQNGGYKSNTIKVMCTLLKDVFTYAIDLEITTFAHNPFRGKKLGIPKTGKGITREFSFAEEIALYEACKRSEYPWLHDAISISLLTGLRRGNAISMKWKWVDFEQRVITVPALSFKRKLDDKTPHVSYISDRVLEILERRFAEFGDKSPYVFPRIYYTKNWVIRSDYNKPIAGQLYWSSFTRAKNEAGIDDANVHTMRHDFACKAIQTPGNELHHVQKMMGHQSIQSTQIYARLKTEDVMEATKRTFDKPNLQLVDCPKSIPKAK